MDTWSDSRRSATSIGQSKAEREQACGFPARSSHRLSIRRSLDRAQGEEPNLKTHRRRMVGFLYLQTAFSVAGSLSQRWAICQPMRQPSPETMPNIGGIGRSVLLMAWHSQFQPKSDSHYALPGLNCIHTIGPVARVRARLVDAAARVGSVTSCSKPESSGNCLSPARQGPKARCT